MKSMPEKILIKIPRLEQKIFSCFSFLFFLTEEFPKAEINIIVESGDALAFKFLPFKVKVFERPKEKQSLVETHHFVANLHEVFNIDLFFDLEGTFNSAFIGYNFRSTVRVGFENGWNKYLLTNRFPPSREKSFEKIALELFENFFQKKLSAEKINHQIFHNQKNEKIDQLFSAPEPPKFLMIMVDNFSQLTKNIEFWKEFFDHFHGQHFIIWSRNDEDIVSEIFAKLDLNQNKLFMHRGSIPSEICLLLKKVDGVITDNFWSEGLCLFHGIPVIAFIRSEDEEVIYSHFKEAPCRVIVDRGLPYLLKGEEEKSLVVFNELIDFIHFEYHL